MTDVLISPAVQQVLGGEGVQRAQSVSLTGGICPDCGRPLDPAEPATVIALISGKVTYVRYAHPACSGSEVRELATAPQPPADGVSMSMTAGVIDHGAAELPVLIAEATASVYTRDRPGGDLTDATVSYLLDQGFSLVARLRHAPAPVPGWAAALLELDEPGADGLLVLEPDGQSFYQGSVVLPEQWRALAERYRWAVLYAGSAGLADLEDAKARVRALRAAAQAGRLVGGRISLATG